MKMFTKRELADKRASGMSYQALHQEYGIPETTIRNICEVQFPKFEAKVIECYGKLPE